MQLKLNVPQGVSIATMTVSIRAKFYYKTFLFFLFQSLQIKLGQFLKNKPHGSVRGNRDMGPFCASYWESNVHSKGILWGKKTSLAFRWSSQKEGKVDLDRPLWTILLFILLLGSTKDSLARALQLFTDRSVKHHKHQKEKGAEPRESRRVTQIIKVSPWKQHWLSKCLVVKVFTRLE